MAVLVVLWLSAASCSSSSSSDDGGALGPDATIGSSSPSSTEAPDPYAIPDDPADIDEAYVQRVVDALYEVDGEATSLFLADAGVTDEAVDRLRAVYSGETFDEQLAGWEQLVQDPSRLAAFRDPPGALRHSVIRVVERTDDCVTVEAERTYERVLLTPGDPSLVFLGLEARDSSAPRDMNRTPWVLFADGLLPTGQAVPEGVCDGA